jgi:hypothetical protein
MDQRKATKEKRSTERKARGKAEESMKATKHSPAGKKAAESLKEKRALARKTQQANYQKSQARASTRIEGRRKQIEAGLHARIEE